MSNTNGTDTSTAAAGPEQAAPVQVIPQMDLGEMLDAAIRKAVTAQITAEAKDIAAGVVAAMLTPEARAGMRETAILEAQAALEPALTPEPEPEPEPEAAAAEEAAEEGEDDKELCYRNVEAFVDGYVAELYRREVIARGSEKNVRWCPRWWDHGEVAARMEALWRAFEQARHGDGAEMAGWWVQLADPMMDRIFDLKGPFEHCSVADGHKDKLARLPLVAAPEGMFPDGHAHDEPATPTPSSGIVVPRPRIGSSRVIKVFPG
ncbi:DUF4913 domain-containing protein [Nocardia gipuzkoensis]